MKIDEWNRISEDIFHTSKDNAMLCVSGGLLLLEQKQHDCGGKDFQVSAEHDELFASGPSPENIHWFDSELDDMARWGWRWDADIESWAKFT